MISGMISWKTMNSVYQEGFWLTIHTWIHIWIHEKSWIHIWIHEKNIWIRVYQEVSRQRILIYEFIYEFIFTHVNSYMNSYMKTFFMNSYMNSYMNSCTWILKIWMHIWIHIRINIIWRSGCSQYGDQGVPDPNDDVDFGFGAAAAAIHRVSEAGCCERRRAAAPSFEWDGPRRVTGPRRLRRAAASDGGQRRVTAVTALEYPLPLAKSKTSSACSQGTSHFRTPACLCWFNLSF